MNIEFPSSIPKSHPYDLCMHFNSEDKLMGYLTYCVYKDYKLEKIKQYKEKHGNKEPGAQWLATLKDNLSESDYSNFIQLAEKKRNDFFASLASDAVQKQLPEAVRASNYQNLVNIMDFCATKDRRTKTIGNAIFEIHNATNHKCWAFWKNVLASMLGAFLLALLFVVLDVLLKIGILQLIYENVVPMHK